MNADSKSPNRFSPLILILVAIAIVLLLASLFLPALAKAKSKAQRISAHHGMIYAAMEAPRPHLSTESYDYIAENAFRAVDQNPLSTFSIDVDTASYSNMRRFLHEGQLPPKDAIRIEEMINYFSYNYPPPTDGRPFSAHVEIAGCPWNSAHRLARIALQGKVLEPQQRPACNLVFLIDVSGSMAPAHKLPLLVRALEMLVEQLNPNDRVAIVVYAGNSGLVLDSTADRKSILAALRRLEAGGSTNGEAGLALAYQTALRHFIEDGINRVILCTDGDFNVGVTSEGELVRLIQEKAKSGVYLTVLGFGMGNYKDSTLEKLSGYGNGNYGYIDSLVEARKVLVEQLTGTLLTIARDVKIQIEFNPARVSAYRVIGYENRMLRSEEFNNDEKDAGELGSGHTVTALYEIVPAGQSAPIASVDPLKYQQAGAATSSRETMTVKFRYKLPNEETSSLLEMPVADSGEPFASASRDFKFAAGVAAFGMVLRDSAHKGASTFDLVEKLTREGSDNSESRQEFRNLVRTAAGLAARTALATPQ